MQVIPVTYNTSNYFLKLLEGFWTPFTKIIPSCIWPKIKNAQNAAYYISSFCSKICFRILTMILQFFHSGLLWWNRSEPLVLMWLLPAVESVCPSSETYSHYNYHYFLFLRIQYQEAYFLLPHNSVLSLSFMFSFTASISDSLILLVSNVYCIRTQRELEMYGFSYFQIFLNYVIQIKCL